MASTPDETVERALLSSFAGRSRERDARVLSPVIARERMLTQSGDADSISADMTAERGHRMKEIHQWHRR
jgi:hypothetical protein